MGRIRPLLDKLPNAGFEAAEEAERYLRGLVRRGPEIAKPELERYLLGSHPNRYDTVCWVFWMEQVPWDTAVLGPLLNEKRSIARRYPFGPGNEHPDLLMRVCDEAAETLSKNHPELKFDLSGTRADLDKQIAVMREQLKKINQKK